VEWIELDVHFFACFGESTGIINSWVLGWGYQL